MRVLAFGDSITYGAWDSQGGWADRLKRLLHQRYVDSGSTTKVQFINLGIGGDTSTKILARLQSETNARYSASWPDVFIFAFGTNDARTTNDVVETELDTFCDNTKEIIQIAQKYSERIMFVGLPPLQNAVLDFKTHTYDDEQIRVYEAALREVVVAAGLPLVELRAAFEPRRQELFSVDGLHPNDAGHELIASLVYPELDRLLQS